ncbi:MAG: M28 family peptidase [Acidobacteriota bacterium]
MKTRIILIAAGVAGLAFQAAEKAPFNDAIVKEEMRAELFFLAGDAMQGRLTDTPANYLAEEYIKSRFEALGLKPAGGGGSYFQNFTLVTSTLGEGNYLEVKKTGKAALRLEPGQDYYPHFYSAGGRAEGRVVFVGFGITAPDLAYDDYRGADLNGAIALALNHEPGERDPGSPFDGVVRAEESSSLRKALFAQQRGASAVLFVSDVHNHPGTQNFEAEARRYWPEHPPRIPRYTLGSWADRVHIPVAEVSTVLAGILVEPTGKTLEELSRSAETASGVGPVPLGPIELVLNTGVRRRYITERNVVGMIEGSDAKLKEESVLLFSHHDHNGADGDMVYAGADDAISGVVGTIQIAKAYGLAAGAGQRPRRSVIFASWEAEERGLLGAWAYAEDPFLPRDKIAAALNMDMIGRNEEVQEGGGGRFRGLEIQTAESNRNAVNILGTVRCPDLRTESERANKEIGLDLKFRYDNNVSNLMRRSDHWPFIQLGVPGLWILTGLHPDYHTIYDRPEKVNYEKLEKIVRLVHQMSWNLARQNPRPKLLPRKKT